MSLPDPREARQEERQKKLREAQRLRRRDRVRLGLLLGGLVLVLVVYRAVGMHRSSEDGAPSAAPSPPIQSQVALPPVDHAALAAVHDARPEERIVLESEAFRGLAKMARALLPAHLRALGEPALPFDQLPEHASELRGKPFRLRGELLSAQIRRRQPGLPQEYWCWIRSEAGPEYFFVSLKIPDQLFGSENFVLTDGYFFKVYTQVLDGESVTAPLLVGRQLTPSFRRAAPVEKLDPVILAEVRDNPLGVDEGLDQTALWHLLGYAHTLAQDPKRLEAEFARAPEFTFQTLKELSIEPSLYRGKAFRIPGRVPADPGWRWSEVAGENPLRAQRLHYGYLGNLSFGDYPLLLVSADDYRIEGKEGRWFYGWFLELQGYVDKKDTPRRTPVFVVAGDEYQAPKPPPVYGQILWWFLGLALLVAGLLVVMIRRDRRKSEEAAALLRKRRRERMAPLGPGPGPGSERE